MQTGNNRLEIRFCRSKRYKLERRKSDEMEGIGSSTKYGDAEDTSRNEDDMSGAQRGTQGTEEVVSRPDAEDMKRIIKELIGLITPEEKGMGKRLTQVLCTVQESTYHAEHIGGNNQVTKKFGKLKVGPEILDDECDKELMMNCNDDDSVDGDFGM